MASRAAALCLARSNLLSKSFTRQPIRKVPWTRQAYPSSRYFSATTSNFEKKYTREHEWVEVSEDGTTGTIGITEYAAHALGDVVYVDLPAVDDEFSAGDAIGAVESVKSASDIMTPVTGIVVEINTQLEEKPGNINKSPEGDAWLAKFQLKDQSELEGLLDADAYKAFTDEIAEE